MCSRKPDRHIPSTFVAAGMMPPRANHAWTVFCAQGAALVASRGSQGLAPGLERLSRAARARPLASGTSARMSMRLLTVADLPAHAEVLGRRAQGWQLACHSAHKHASAEASRRAGVAPLACGCTFMIVQKVVRKVEAG